MGIEAPGERSERRHDDLGRGFDEAAARDLAALEAQPELGMEMPRDFGADFFAHRLMAQDDAGNFDLFGDAAAAMVGEARIVVADDPRPVDRGGEVGEQSAGIRRQPVAAEAIMEAVAQAIEAFGGGALDLAG
jgi:hypothetical protein